MAPMFAESFSDLHTVQQFVKFRDYFFARPVEKKLLKPWTAADIDRFCKDDPVHGAQVKTLRQAGIITALGGVGSGAFGATWAFRRGGTINGGIISGIICGVSSAAIGLGMSQQLTVYTHSLWTFDKMETTKAFRGWWRAHGGAPE
eukprot:CAMPEP_0173389626 /NCGR_PEP_ID=MMETSP1356-20130122/12790_1 /TAXON_ID=77927 ORGANISM="Hemiselmis virescens, Strain PCC157" /NCGR_SAMPLE_ID=MMETSP1356 /ASSEMBLY_ACC=CAM_ASM_000847 /LENGTH=145 /DNA_ID=CAMNT_0014346839 /DNA_START=30 /DNA_END=467 /DNA_ORIENTATION=+